MRHSPLITVNNLPSSHTVHRHVDALKDAVDDWVQNRDDLCKLGRTFCGPEYDTRRLKNLLGQHQITCSPTRSNPGPAGSKPEEDTRKSLTGCDSWYATSFLKKYLDIGERAFESSEQPAEGLQHTLPCQSLCKALIGDSGAWCRFWRACAPFKDMFETSSSEEVFASDGSHPKLSTTDTQRTSFLGFTTSLRSEDEADRIERLRLVGIRIGFGFIL